MTAARSANRLLKGGLALGFLIVALSAWVAFWSPPKVKTILPQRGNAAEVVYATGTVEPRDWAKVVSLYRRRIIEICSCEGKRVRKGDVLARLDNIEERAVLNELEARRQTLKADAERIAILLKRDAATQVSYDEKLTQIREYDARIAAQKDRIFDLELVAPIDGVVLRSDATVGEIAGTGDNDVLFWVGELKPLEVNSDVNEEDIAKIQLGQEALLRHDGFPNKTLSAAVAHLTPKGDPNTKTFSITLALPDDTPLQIGMSVEANIVVRKADNVLLLPIEAIKDGFVQTVADHRIRKTPVTTGIRGGRMAEIASGIDEKTPVVTPWEALLADGERVQAVAGARK